MITELQHTFTSWEDKERIMQAKRDEMGVMAFRRAYLVPLAQEALATWQQQHDNYTFATFCPDDPASLYTNDIMGWVLAAENAFYYRERSNLKDYHHEN